MRPIKFYTFINILVLLYLLYLYTTAGSSYNYSLCISCICICLCEACIVIFNNSDLNRVIIRPTSILIISLLIVFVQSYIDLVLGNFAPTYNAFRFPETINRAIIISAIAFTSFSITYIQSHHFRLSTQQQEPEALLNTKLKIITIINVISFAWWLSSLSSDFLSGAAYIDSGKYNEGHTSYPELVYKISTYVALIIFIKSLATTNDITMSKFFRRMPKLILYPILIYILFLVMSGDRGNAIYTIFALFFGYTFTTKAKVRLWVFIPLLILGAFIMTSLSFGRQMGDELTFAEKLTYVSDNQDDLKDANEIMESFSPFTSELAHSSSCTHIALYNLENNKDRLSYGQFTLCYLLQIIPIIGTEIINSLGIPIEERSTSEYITVTTSGKFYESGFGTNVIADLYLDYRLIGVIIGFLIMGFLCKKIDYNYIHASHNNISWRMLALIIFIGATAIVIPRSYLLYHVRTFIYIIFLYTIISKCALFSNKNY